MEEDGLKWFWFWPVAIIKIKTNVMPSNVMTSVTSCSRITAN